MNKNISPARISTYTTVVLGAIFVLICFFLKVTVFKFLIAIFVFCSLTFLIILFGLEYFIYRKIKIIYKTINNLKKTKFEFNHLNPEEDSIEKVNQEVLNWANEKKQEITSLQANEEYRKQFIGNISHELKTPIFSIQGYVETLLDGAIDDHEVNRRFLEKIANNTDRLNLLVKDLLTISELEGNNKELYLSNFDINELTKDIFENLISIASEKKIILNIKEGCDKPTWVMADRNKIIQVLNNLITNAIYYGKENGSVLVSFYDMDENYLIEVTDDGEGIEQEHLPRLFERFYRTDKSRARNKGGTGLGLSIVKHIIEAHNQTINVRSSVGVGTTFGFTLAKKN